LGNALYRTGAVDAARAAYRQALHLRPEYPEATHNLALLEDEPAA
jgi:Flp pilus assembly protein TadD